MKADVRLAARSACRGLFASSVVPDYVVAGALPLSTDRMLEGAARELVEEPVLVRVIR